MTATSLSPGSVVGGDFRILRRLSQGGMGAVYVAEQISTGKPRAVKLMHAQIAADPRFRERFEQEARVGARIESEHVVEVVAAGVDPAAQTPWLAMELLDGSDLSALVDQRGPLPPGEVREMMGQLCHALAAAHRAGVVHRDLKPENIFIARSRQQNVPFKVKVLDFGVAKIVAEARATTSLTASVGTPLWMAPEQTEPSRHVTPASDVWSLGLLVYYLLTARTFWLEPSRGPNASVMSLMREVLFVPLEPPSTRAARQGCAHLIPAGFDAWFTRCVSRDPRARFADAAQAMAALDPVLTAAAQRPAAPTPAQPIPAQAMSGQPMPAQAMSSQPMQAQAVSGPPLQAMPGQPMPAQAMPAQPIPTQPAYAGPTYPAIARTDLGGTLVPVPRRTSTGLVLALAGGALFVVALLVIGGVLLLRRASSIERSAPARGGNLAPIPGGPSTAPAGTLDPRHDGLRVAGPASGQPDLAGTYDITSSRNPGGQGGYSGHVVLSRTGDTYGVAWTIAKGPGYEGIALVHDRTLAVGWASGGVYGAAVYQLDGARLHGRWIATDRPGQIEAEELQGPEGLSGSYRIVRGARSGTVLIVPTGDTYAVTWTLATGTLRGVGIRAGDQLVVGWAPSQQVGVVSYAIEGNQLTGRWASLGGTMTGAETLLRR